MDDQEIIIRTLEKEKELLQKQLRKKIEEIDEYTNNSKMLIDKLKTENKELREKLDSILYSRSYKFSQKIVKLLKKKSGEL